LQHFRLSLNLATNGLSRRQRHDQSTVKIECDAVRESLESATSLKRVLSHLESDAEEKSLRKINTPTQMRY
jgi:hypothetical protein